MNENNHGGKRENSGRPTKMDEEKANTLFSLALKNFYNKEDDDDGRVALLEDLLTSFRGKIFIAEHVYGKAKQKIESDINLSGDKVILTDEQIENINRELLRK